MKILGALLILFIVLTGCNSYSDNEMTEFDKEIQSYLKKKKIKCKRSSSGLYYSISDPGAERKIKYQDVVKFCCKGELLNGKVFQRKSDTLEFKVEVLIGGWKEIMLEMGEGGKAFIVAPPHLGYGKNERNKIPAHSSLVFDIEVLEVN